VIRGQSPHACATGTLGVPVALGGTSIDADSTRFSQGTQRARLEFGMRFLEVLILNNLTRYTRRLVMIAGILAPLGLAQMGGGMMGNGSYGTGMGGNGTMTGASGMSGGMAGGMGDMMSGPAVGPDGTAYVLRRNGTATQGLMDDQTVKTDLVAISPSTGKATWNLSMDGTMLSEPVLSKDGLTIFLTTSEPGMDGGSSGNGMHGNATSTTNRKPALVIVANSIASARIQNRVDIDADMLSAPRLTPDGQTLYVTALNLTKQTGQSASSNPTSMGATLYAFSPAGALKFKVDLGQVQMGSSMGH
jgi:hypothetical protein